MGAKSSRQANAPAVEPVVEAAVETAKVDIAATKPDVDVVKPMPENALADAEIDVEVDERSYEDVLARCAELKRMRQALRLARAEVRSTIARFAPVFEDTDESQSSDSHDDDSQEDGEGEADQREASSNVAHASCVDQAVRDMPSHEDLLREEEELEDQVEMLRDTLSGAGSMIASIVEKSHELSEHLEEVESRVQMPTKLTSNDVSDTSSDTSTTATEQVFSACTVKPNELDFKLPNLKFLTTPGINSHASSSTATPRSDSESRPVSARNQTGIEA